MKRTKTPLFFTGERSGQRSLCTVQTHKSVQVHGCSTASQLYKGRLGQIYEHLIKQDVFKIIPLNSYIEIYTLE